MNELTHHEELSSLGIWLGHDQQKTWLHFDCAHNLMLQIRGKKTFLLASPSHYLDLYPYTFKTCKGQDMKGEIYRFSEVNAWKPQLDQYPRSGRVQFLEAPLERGDGLLLPMGWWHAVLSEGERASSCEDDASSCCCCCGFNIALNAFWDADESFWAKRNHLKSFRKTYK
ncbi:hypothetical protein C9374_012704 [Naegleria lovaniensis]|uniref:JmjC domain-containing protein n=1 Tax=Naegleria lovaniensis TaxID=51637 RepID=A0AA88KQL2_NAELO|nr:uncharacterized protein C9374_012704 [Naegleria lovaniensis]KAG2392452.1 hypothetical protein C9374_012704 [Naegleria lovaniensis]